MPSLCRLLRAKDLFHIVYQKLFCFSVSSFKFLINSVNQIPIFLLTLPQKVKYSKVNQIQASEDIAPGNSPVVSAVSPLQLTGHPIQELHVVTASNNYYYHYYHYYYYYYCYVPALALQVAILLYQAEG